LNPSQVSDGEGLGVGLGVGAGGVGVGTGPSVMTMSAQLLQTWSVSSQSQRHESTYSPGLLGTFTSSMTLNLLPPPTK